MNFKPSSLITFAGLASLAFGQAATPSEMAGVAPSNSNAILHFHTKLGSFKIIDGTGRVEITFSGTVLVSDLKAGHVEMTGKVKKEYTGHGREVYFGTGKAVITGSWRGLQWFGHDMSGVWFGHGVMRASGEFDKDLNTGEYWYQDATKKQPWTASSVLTLVLPAPKGPGDIDVVPRERKKGG